MLKTWSIAREAVDCRPSPLMSLTGLPSSSVENSWMPSHRLQDRAQVPAGGLRGPKHVDSTLCPPRFSRLELLYQLWPLPRTTPALLLLWRPPHLSELCLPITCFSTPPLILPDWLRSPSYSSLSSFIIARCIAASVPGDMLISPTRLRIHEVREHVCFCYHYLPSI